MFFDIVGLAKNQIIIAQCEKEHCNRQRSVIFALFYTGAHMATSFVNVGT
jgi:hypothetical protein